MTIPAGPPAVRTVWVSPIAPRITTVPHPPATATTMMPRMMMAPMARAMASVAVAAEGCEVRIIAVLVIIIVLVIGRRNRGNDAAVEIVIVIVITPANHPVVRFPAAARVRPPLHSPSLPGIMSRVPVVVVAGFEHVAAAARMVVVLGTRSSPWVEGGGRVNDLLVSRSDHAAAVKRERGRGDGGTLHARSREFERAARHPTTTHRSGGAHSFSVFQEVPGSFSGEEVEEELFAGDHAERLVGLWDGMESGGVWRWRRKGVRLLILLNLGVVRLRNGASKTRQVG